MTFCLPATTAKSLLKPLKEEIRSLKSEFLFLTLQVPEIKIAEFANSVDPDKLAHNEPPQLDLHCLSTSF